MLAGMKTLSASGLVAGLLWGMSMVSIHALEVETDFDGASVRVLGVDAGAQEVRFMPGGQAERGWPCWWYFRIAGINPGQPLTLKLSGSDAVVGKGLGGPLTKPLSSSWAMPERAAWSTDGKTWLQTEPGKKGADGQMVYQVPAAGPSAKGRVLVAWGPPYTPARAEEWVRQTGADHRVAEEMELCRSREGRRVSMLRISEGDKVAERRFGVWVHARQHAWESGSSWVCQGFVEWILSADVNAAWLRQNAEIYVVPVMDVDNAATGNGGKDALPQDHNRDWSDKPNWNEVAAAQKILRGLVAEGRLDVFLDLHNPAPGDLKAFFYAPAVELLQPEAKAFQADFLKLARKEIEPVMPMLAEPKITASSYHPLWRQISGNWVQANGNPKTVALCLETPWNTARSTTEGYLNVGAALARALRAHLQDRTP